jgi:uncharacterized membrane protein YdjX (TVP38/TMEM64 family)
MTPWRYVPRIAVAVTLVAAAGWMFLHREQLQIEPLQQQLTALGAWAPATFLLLYALGTVLLMPGSLWGLIGGALFGPLWGSLWNLTGATLGATLSFLVARYLGAHWVARRARGRLARIVAGVEAEGWRFVLLARLVPIVPFNLLNFALGLTRIRAAHYVIATAIGMLPGTIAYTWIGHAGREIAAGSETALRSGLLAVGGLALLMLLPRLVRRIRGSNGNPTDPERRATAEFREAADRVNGRA